MKTLLKYSHLILPHLGIALVILAMALGYFYNWRGKAVLLTTDKTNVFITKNKEIKIVPFALTLTQFNTEYYDSGAPKTLEAIIDVEENIEQKTKCNPSLVTRNYEISLSINHPCKMAFGQDLYLINYDKKNLENPEWCVVELVYDPFQGLFLAGIILVMAGLILMLLPFFLPNNKFAALSAFISYKRYHTSNSKTLKN